MDDVAVAALFLTRSQLTRVRSEHEVSDPKKTNRIRLLRIMQFRYLQQENTLFVLLSVLLFPYQMRLIAK